MTNVTLISGSTLGSAEYVAEHLAGKLQDAGFTSETLHGPLLSEIPAAGLWLIVSSTHGAGDLPDNIQPLYDELSEQRPDLSGIKYGAIGIGSREYDTFCGAIEKLDALLSQCGAQRLGSLLRINVLDHEIPEDPAEIWLAEWMPLIGKL